ncbi:MAG: SCP2 sterol-binding domain-containing protein [Rhodospirillaceae bacterium]
MRSSAAPFSPLLLLGLALRPVPAPAALGLSRPILDAIARRLGPLVRDRLQGLSGTVAVLPTDFPYGLMVSVGAHDLTLEAVDAATVPAATACLRAPAFVLLDLAEGRGRDGDASFFARDLVMEGDTALVMALRYALEDAADSGAAPFTLLADSLPLPTAWRGRVAAHLEATARLAADDVRKVQAAVLEPLRAWRARVDARLDIMEDRLTRAERQSRTRSSPPVPRKEPHASDA